MKTVGTILKEHREKANFSVEKFSQITKLSKNVIIDIESDNFKKLSGDFYIKKYIKTYARYLKLKESALLEVYENQTFQHPKRKERVIETKKKTKHSITPNILKIFAILILAIAIIGYLITQVSIIFQEPFLEVVTPDQNLIITQSYIEIRGITEKEANVFINGKEILTDSSGVFITTLDLIPGINLVTISAKKKHSKESVIYREILVQ